MTDRTPNPGSPEAIDAGCRCSATDNHHGRGRPVGHGERVFVMVGDCPLHGAAVEYRWRGEEEK